MRVLVNALSAEAPSGKHVLYGHLRQLARWTIGQHEFHVICDDRSRPAEMNFGPNVHWHEAPSTARGWLRRSMWEFITLPRWLKERKIDLYFTPSGTVVPGLPVPQVSLAQNPWCLTSAVPKHFAARCKAFAQRAAYRRAHLSADAMIYNSNHIRTLYRQNAGSRLENRGLVVYQGLDDETHQSAAQSRDIDSKQDFAILCVSVMARWKNCETLLRALKRLHSRQIPATLRLIGGWPEPRYRQEIEATIRQLELGPHVQIEGHVTRSQLNEAYRSSRVFCLLSRCESFGIPAVEAQVFGTPVVGSNTCAMPEIGGDGGVYIDPDDEICAAMALERLLTDKSYWLQMSEAAIQNSVRFRWETCSRPLLDLLCSEFSATDTVVESASQSGFVAANYRQGVFVRGKQGTAS